MYVYHKLSGVDFGWLLLFFGDMFLLDGIEMVFASKIWVENGVGLLTMLHTMLWCLFCLSEFGGTSSEVSGSF